MKTTRSEDERKKQTESARIARQTTARKNDQRLERYIKQYPGYTSTQLEEVFQKFPRSYLVNALKRLEGEKRIISKPALKGQKIIKRYYINYDGEKSPNIIEILPELLDRPEQWQQFAYAYALANNEIKVSPTEHAELKKNSLAYYRIAVASQKDSIRITLPKNVVNFYRLDFKNYDLEIANNIISLKIIPEVNKRSHASQYKRRILIMEDDEYWRKELYERFRNAGHSVFAAKTAEEALAIFNDEQINYLILDWDINGIKIAEKVFLQMKRKNRKVQGALFTAFPIPDKKWEEFTRLGFRSIIPKQRQGDADKAIEEICNEQLSHLGAI